MMEDQQRPSFPNLVDNLVKDLVNSRKVMRELNTFLLKSSTEILKAQLTVEEQLVKLDSLEERLQALKLLAKTEESISETKDRQLKQVQMELTELRQYLHDKELTGESTMDEVPLNDNQEGTDNLGDSLLAEVPNDPKVIEDTFQEYQPKDDVPPGTVLDLSNQDDFKATDEHEVVTLEDHNQFNNVTPSNVNLTPRPINTGIPN